MLRRVNSIDTIVRKGNEICREFQKFCFADGTRATCSGGVTICGTNEKPSAKAIERADTALYRGRERRKTSVCAKKKQVYELSA